MQAEILVNRTAAESRSRSAAALSTLPKCAFSFFYIGKNNATSQYFADSFESGATAETYAEAKTLLFTSAIAPDVIFIDLPYSETDLQEFLSFEALAQQPGTVIIYNEKQFLSRNLALKHIDTIDDIIDFTNTPPDFFNKISFLKKTRAYCQQPAPAPVAPTAGVHAEISFGKRLFDVVVSLTLIMLLSPLFLLIAALIRLESRGPIFYNARRAGRGFRIFKFYKFRTMEVNADKKVEALAHLNQYGGSGDGPKFFKISNDPRITKVGRILRNTSLDELPQLFNVLKGDMSLVGNRPLPLYEAATLTTNEFVERFMAPAGITGLWQIKKRGQSEMSIEERISLDISYARRYNLMYDLWIMANTPRALIQKTNA